MKKLCILLSITLSASFLSAQTGTWTQVATPCPHDNMGVCLLLPNGTVICHNTNGGGEGTGWDRLTPDIHGSYVNGTWDTIASMNNDRLFFSSQVLPNGEVYVAGGEYGSGGPAGGEVYNPVTNTWTVASNFPSGWNIYDGNSEILYNGTVLEGPQIGADPSFDCLFWTQSTNSYSIAPTALLNHDEAEWLKLPDSSILFVGISNDTSNRYIPQTNTWVYDANTPGMLYDGASEAGCAFMLPNGQAIFFGATPFNTLYTPSGSINTPGIFAPADSFPTIEGCPVGQDDASGAMMVNGHILCAVSPDGACAGEFASPTYFVEYDYVTNTFTQVMSPIPNMGGDSIPTIACFQTQMLDLPDGTVLVSMSQSSSYSTSYLIYTPGSGPIPQGKPTINAVTETSCGNYVITGKLFNGISEGAAYGDDWQMSTNYPLVRLTNSAGDVYYATTFNWNRIGAVQTDSLKDTADFVLPSMPGGTYSLVVVANGFASNPTLFTTFGAAITSQTNINCTGTGSATVTASDGSTPYTYVWSPTGGNGSTATGLTAGTYTVTVTDNGGCAVSASVTITQTASLTSTPDTTGISCNGGSNGIANANISGGALPYTYLWQGGATTSSVSGLSAGTYTVTVHDSCGNSATAATLITQPVQLSIVGDSIIPILCNGEMGSASIISSGGTSPYTYTWSGGGGTNEFASLSAGTYTVTVQDSCGSSVTSTVTITQPSPLVVTTDSMDANSGVCSGEAWVNASGGTSPYTYLWTTGSQTTDTITGQCAGNYCCTVTDYNGCTQTTCVEVTSGIQNIEAGTSLIDVYPNPNDGIFTVGSLVSGGLSTMEIYNVLGQNVYSNTLEITKGSSFEINMSDKAAGIYFYRLLKADGSLLGEGKLIIQK